MRPVEDALEAAFPDERLQRADRLSDVVAFRRLADLYVVCQSWPDEYPESEVAGLLSLCAAARVVCVCGRWCDSEGRTRDRWPLAVRVPAGELAPRLAFELRVLSGAQPPLALTASRGEIFAATASDGPRSEPDSA